MAVVVIQVRVGPGKIRVFRYRGTVELYVDNVFLTADGYHVYKAGELIQDTHVFDKFWLSDIVSIVGE